MEREKGKMWIKKKKGGVGEGNNNGQYTALEASDSKEGVASRANWGQTWPKKKEKKEKEYP